MKIIYLLPPSEGKKIGGDVTTENLSFAFDKPYEIAKNATPKDLKCKDARYEQAMILNSNIINSEKLPAIERYTWVMYNAIDYSGMNQDAKSYFDESFFLMSWLYGMLKANDTISNYKLPIETKGLYSFWWDSITQTLNKIGADYVVDFLPNAYKKMIDFTKLNSNLIQVDFFQYKWEELKKMTHGVKKVKGEYIKNLCENMPQSIDKLQGEKTTLDSGNIHIKIIAA